MQRSSTRALAVAAAAMLGALSLGGCGSSDSDGGGSGSAGGGFGDCKVTGTPGSIKLTPTTPGTLTVETNLPSPGWWQGTSPQTIDGGYEYCLAATIAHRAGLKKLVVVNASFDALAAGQTKGFDIAMAQISITEERRKVVDFSAPYYESNIGILTKSDAGVTADNVRDKQLAAAVGTTAVTYLQDELKPSRKVRVFQDTDAMVTAVGSGQIDAGVQDTAIVLGFAKQSGGALEVVGQFRTNEQYGAIYPKGSANQAELDKAITSMKSDGSFSALSKQWLGAAFGGDPAEVPFFDAP
jgi:polar amino acid transport system substrate-binding protein